MERLLDGYRRFRQNGWPLQQELYEKLAQQGQQPKALVIACVDSRVDPARVFDTAPGELLTIRNVANLIPPYAPDAAYHGTSAALEFGIKILEIKKLIVLGHGLCGGVRALLEGVPKEKTDFIEPWMSIASSARERALRCIDPNDVQRTCEHEVIKTSLANLMTYPWVMERLRVGGLTLHGAWFSILTGELMLLDANGNFLEYDELDLSNENEGDLSYKRACSF